jgi:hypothetical protein
MLKLLAVVSIVSITISCSHVNVIHDQFDNSNLVKLEFNGAFSWTSFGFDTLNGSIKIDRIVFSKNYVLEKLSDIRLFCKFEGNQGEIFYGDTIEINIDGSILKQNLLASRQGSYEETTGTSSTVFTRRAAYTFSDATRSKVDIIVLECILSKDVQEAILNAKSMMLRVYTENIDGISKNTFRAESDSLKGIKEFIRFTRKQ